MTFAVITVVVNMLLAQSNIVPASDHPGLTIIEHATIHTAAPGAAPIIDGYIVFYKGEIAAVGQGEPHGVYGKPLPREGVENTRRIDGTGMHVTPGFVSSATTLGLVEVPQVRATDDRTEFGQFHPEVQAWVCINPDSQLLPVARMGGVLLALVFPMGGSLSGEASLIRLDGWTNDSIAVVKDSGAILRWPATEPAPHWFTAKNADEQEKARRRALASIDRFFDSAKAYSTARAADPTLKVDLRFERLRDVLDGQRPIFIDASSAGQIESSVLWADKRGMKPVIVGGDGADMVAELLVAKRVPVIIDGVMRLPRFSHDDYDAPYSLPGRLAALGVEVAIATGDEPSNDRNIAHHAAMASAFGMPREEALAAITRVPARIAGAGARYGTLEAGKSATLLLLDGDPLEVKTSVKQAWIDGMSIPLESHQTQMKSKYEQKYRAPASK